MVLRTRVLVCVGLLLALVTLGSAQKKKETESPRLLLPPSVFDGGLLVGTVVGDDDSPMPDKDLTITGGYPGVLTGEVVGDDVSHPGQKVGKAPGPTGKPGGYTVPIDAPKDCGTIIRKAGEIIANNPGSDHILVGLLLPAVQRVREAANDPNLPAATIGGDQTRPSQEVREAANDPNMPQNTVTAPPRGTTTPGATVEKGTIETELERKAGGEPGGIIGPSDTRSGGGIWVKANGGGIHTDANGQFALCVTPGTKQLEVGLADGTVRTSIPATGQTGAMCDGSTPQFFQPGTKLDFCRRMSKPIIIQGGREMKLATAQAYSPNGDQVITTALVPRALGPGKAELRYLDEHGRQQGFTGGVFQIVNAELDRSKLHSHEGADFKYELSFTHFGPEYGQTQFGPEYGHQTLCVNVSTTGPVVLTSSPSQTLTVNGDGHATVSGKIRATQVAPGSAVPFAIKLNVHDCATGHH